MCEISESQVAHVVSPVVAVLQQVTLLRESLHGFVFESNRGTRVTMTANSPLGPQFNFGWNNKKGKKLKTKNDVTKDKVRVLYIITILQSLFESAICKQSEAIPT